MGDADLHTRHRGGHSVQAAGQVVLRFHRVREQVVEPPTVVGGDLRAGVNEYQRTSLFEEFCRPFRLGLSVVVSAGEHPQPLVGDLLP